MVDVCIGIGKEAGYEDYHNRSLFLSLLDYLRYTFLCGRCLQFGVTVAVHNRFNPLSGLTERTLVMRIGLVFRNIL